MKTISLAFSIYTEPEGRLPLWDETQSAVIVDQGVFNVPLGSVIPLDDDVFAVRKALSMAAWLFNRCYQILS